MKTIVLIGDDILHRKLELLVLSLICSIKKTKQNILINAIFIVA